MRTDVGRNADPYLHYAIIDLQSVKTTSATEERGIDGGKTKGHKRHIVVDTMGNLLAVVAYAANIHGTNVRCSGSDRCLGKYPSIQRLCADAGYQIPLTKMFPVNWTLESKYIALFLYFHASP